MLDTTADWLTDGRRKKPSRNESCDWLSSLLGAVGGYKATANGEMSVACPATRRDGCRRFRLRKRKEPKITLKVRYLKLQTAKVRNFKLQSAKVKIFKLESSNFKLEIAKVRNFKVRK